MSQSTPATIESLRAKFLSIINRPAPSPQPQVKVTQEPKGEEGLVVEKVLVQTEEEEWAPVFLVKVSFRGHERSKSKLGLAFSIGAIPLMCTL